MTLHSSQRPIVVTSPKTSDACGVEVHLYHNGSKVYTVVKQITTLFAVPRRCLYSIDQKILLGFLLIYAYTDAVLSSKSNNLLLSNVISRILCSEWYICKYTLYFR